MTKTAFDDKKFLVFMHPDRIRFLLKKESPDIDADDLARFETACEGVIRALQHWAKEQGGEVHFTLKAGPRTRRCTYRLVFADGDQSSVLQELEREVSRAIAAAAADVTTTNTDNLGKNSWQPA